MPGTETHRAEKTFRAWVLILLIAVVATYANHFGNRFHFDDFHTIVHNSYIKSLANIPLFFTDATTFSALPSNQSYRPLVSLTLAVDHFLGNGNIFFFHFSTFLLFLLQGGLMFILYRDLMETAAPSPANRYVALTAVAWYLLHPANAETINYVIARSDSLSAFFMLLALVIYLRSPLARRWHLYLAAVALACLAKPVAGIFALLLPLWLFFRDDPALTLRQRLSGALLKSAPAMAACLALLIFIRQMDPPTWQAGGTSLYHYMITQPYVALHYFITFFAPLALSADTDWTTLPSAADWRFAVGLGFLAALCTTAACAARAQRWRPVAFGLLWFLLCLLPTSLVPLAEVMNDHRLFLPYIGLALAVTWTGYRVLLALAGQPEFPVAWQRRSAFIAAVALACYAYGTHVRNSVWRTEETLWHDVTIKSPQNSRGHMNYGVSLMGKGDFAGAERQFNEALRITPDYPFLHVNLAILLGRTGRTVEAEVTFQRAIALSPRLPEAYYWYASFLKGEKRYEEAAACARKVLRLTSAHLPARKLLMAVYREEGRYRELAVLAEETRRLAPGDPEVAGYLAAAKQAGDKR